MHIETFVQASIRIQGYMLEGPPRSLSHENKTIVITGDFNIDLLKYDTEKDSADFLDSMYAGFLLPYISTPSRVTPHSKILNDNIFSNNIEDSSIQGNIVITISDHYAQFLLQQLVLELAGTLIRLCPFFPTKHKF